MELRRALLLFAIVLGLAAIASSLSRPVSDEGRRTSDDPPPRARSTPTATPTPGPSPPAEVRFEADLRPETRSVPPDRATTVTVTAYEPGLVEIEELGLSEPAEPNGPARLELLSGSAETYAVTFTPLSGEKQRKIGVIEVEGR